MESIVPTAGGKPAELVARAFQPVPTVVKLSAPDARQPARPAAQSARHRMPDQDEDHGPEGPCLDGMDLRRRRTRDFADLMLRRSEWITPRDRAIVVAIYEHGESAAAVARLCNIRADLLRHRLRLLARRMQTPEFSLVATSRQKWPPKLRKVATACFLHGMTMRQAADELKMTLHDVRRNRDVVRAMVQEWEEGVRNRPIGGGGSGKGG